MNYPDVNHLFEKRDCESVAIATEWTEIRTLPNGEVSILAKIIVGYFRNGNYERCVVLSGASCGTMFALGMKALKISYRNAWFTGFLQEINTVRNRERPNERF